MIPVLRSFFVRKLSFLVLFLSLLVSCVQAMNLPASSRGGQQEGRWVFRLFNGPGPTQRDESVDHFRRRLFKQQDHDRSLESRRRPRPQSDFDARPVLSIETAAQEIRDANDREGRIVDGRKPTVGSASACKDGGCCFGWCTTVPCSLWRGSKTRPANRIAVFPGYVPGPHWEFQLELLSSLLAISGSAKGAQHRVEIKYFGCELRPLLNEVRDLRAVLRRLQDEDQFRYIFCSPGVPLLLSSLDDFIKIANKSSLPVPLSCQMIELKVAEAETALDDLIRDWSGGTNDVFYHRAEQLVERTSSPAVRGPSRAWDVIAPHVREGTRSAVLLLCKNVSTKQNRSCDLQQLLT